MSPLVGLLQLRYNSPNNYLSKHTHFKRIYIMVLHTDKKREVALHLDGHCLCCFTFLLSL